MAKNVIFNPKNAQKIENFLNQPFFKLQTSMIAQNDRNKILSNYLFLHFFPGCLEKLKNGKNVIFYPKNAQKIEKIWNLSFFKLQTSMIAQIDRNKILSNFVLLHFFPVGTENLENGKNVIFYPKNDQKIEIFRNFFEIFFWSESIQNGSKRILK